MAGPLARRRSRRLLAVALALVAALGLAAAAVDAATVDEGAAEPAQVTSVDASGSTVLAQLLTTATAPEAVTATEGGAEVAVTTTTARRQRASSEVVYVLDIDNRTASGALADAVAAIDRQLPTLPESVRVATVTAGAEAGLSTRLTADRDKPVDELRNVPAAQGSALHDAIVLAADAFTDQPGVIRTVVAVAGGPDSASVATAARAETALLQAGAQLVVVGIGPITDDLTRLAQRTGGVALAATAGSDADGDASIAGRVALASELAADRLIVSYAAPADQADRPDVELTIDGRTVAFSYPAGALTTNVLQLAPNEITANDGGGLFGHPIVLYVSIGLAFVAISAGLWATGSMYVSGESSLDKVLARYSDHDSTLDDAEVQEMLVQTALVQRAVALTENFAERRGFLTRVEEMLERANVPIRAGEAFFFLAIGVIATTAASLVATGSFFVAAVVGVATAGIGYAGLQVAGRRRLKAFEAQLPDTLQLLAGTLRAGYSLPQGVDAVSHEIDDPMGQELRRAMTEAQLGRELDDALANIAERLDSGDFAWAVMAIGIQREVGGNLAEVLLTVADTMIQRERLKREVNALTAEGRVSAGILSMLPPGLGLIMWLMNPAYVGVLFSRTIGLVLVGLAAVSGLIGLAWMKKVITIDA